MDILCKADIPAGALLDVADITGDPEGYALEKVPLDCWVSDAIQGTFFLGW